MRPYGVQARASERKTERERESPRALMAERDDTRHTYRWGVLYSLSPNISKRTRDPARKEAKNPLRGIPPEGQQGSSQILKKKQIVCLQESSRENSNQTAGLQHATHLHATQLLYFEPGLQHAMQLPAAPSSWLPSNRRNPAAPEPCTRPLVAPGCNTGKGRGAGLVRDSRTGDRRTRVLLRLRPLLGTARPRGPRGLRRDRNRYNRHSNP